MDEDSQPDQLSPVPDLGFVRLLLADLHDDLPGKTARFRQLADLSSALGSNGTLITGGEIAFAAWTEARTSFIHGNYVATIMLCQGLAEHMLASYLELGIQGEKLPNRISFHDTLLRCLARHIIVQKDADDLRRLMTLRNPLSHYRNMDDRSNVSRRAMETMSPVEQHLRGDANFAIGMAVRLMALPAFRVGD